MYRTRPRLRCVCTNEHESLSNETYDVHRRNIMEKAVKLKYKKELEERMALYR
jgi:hypothetical protein